MRTKNDFFGLTIVLQFEQAYVEFDTQKEVDSDLYSKRQQSSIIGGRKYCRGILHLKIKLVSEKKNDQSENKFTDRY